MRFYTDFKIETHQNILYNGQYGGADLWPDQQKPDGQKAVKQSVSFDLELLARGDNVLGQGPVEQDVTV